jgi:ATP-dependent helicase/nuclease subunit A
VHAAKGLEFPIVVIGDAARGKPRAGGVLVDPNLGVLPPLAREEVETKTSGKHKVSTVKPAVYRLAQEKAQDQEAAESDRLLYVAATRAREMLVVSGPAGSSGIAGWLERLALAVPLAEAWNPAPRPGHITVAPLQWKLADQEIGCTVFPAEETLPPVRATATTLDPVDLPENLPLLAGLEPERASPDEDTREAMRDPPRRVWRVVPTRARPTAPAWVVGQLVHSALASWTFPDAIQTNEATTRDHPYGSEPSTRVGFDEWAAAEARSYGLTDEKEIRDAVRRSARMLRRFQQTALYHEMDGADRRFHEVPYEVLVVNGASLPLPNPAQTDTAPGDRFAGDGLETKGVLESGSMDAVFHSTRGWVLVEFKTDRLKNRAHLEKTLQEEDYIEQVGRYQQAAARLLGTRPHPILCFLNCGGQVELVENRWDDLPG